MLMRQRGQDARFAFDLDASFAETDEASSVAGSSPNVIQSTDVAGQIVALGAHGADGVPRSIGWRLLREPCLWQGSLMTSEFSLIGSMVQSPPAY